MDEGPLLAQVPFTLPKTITTPELTAELIIASDQSLQHIIPLWLEGTIEAAPQEAVTIATSTEPTYSRKLSKKDSILDWQKSAEVLEREIRAFAGWPKSRTSFKGLEAVITKAHTIPEHGVPGETAVIHKQPVVYCGDQALVIDLVKPAGKKEMTGEAFLAGYKQIFLS
jgi:methionyl-tRNA formyltransferase